MMLLLCLIFIGQSTASMSMFYTMTAMQSNMQAMAEMSSMKNAHHIMAGSDGSTHDMSAMTKLSDCDEAEMTTACATMATEDCCAQECDCLTSGCSTVSALTTIINYTPVYSTTSKINSTNVLTLGQRLTSLYRPPILS